MSDPFSAADRSAARFSRVRRVAVDLDSGDAPVFVMFVGMMMMVAGVLATSLSESGWAVATLLGGIATIVFATMLMFAYGAYHLAERLLLPLSVRRASFVVADLPLTAVARAARTFSPGPFRFPRSFSPYGPTVDLDREVSRSVVEELSAAVGGDRLLKLFQSLDGLQEVLCDPGVVVGDVAPALGALDDRRFTVLLALTHAEARRVWRPGRAFDGIMMDVKVLASDLTRMPDHQVEFCRSVLVSSSWEGPVGELLMAARIVSAE